MAGINQHVTRDENGKWQVKGENNQQATALFDTQKEVSEKAIEIAKNQKSEVFIHGEDGKIRTHYSYKE